MSHGRVANKVAFITGAGSGIGRATAMLMAREGAITIVSDIDLEAAQSVAGSINSNGGKAEAVDLDVSNESAWQAAIGFVLTNYQKLDILVNNAGISIARPVADSSLDDWRRVMAVNLDGVFLGTSHAIAAMKDGGSIVNVASVSGIQPSGGAAAYCASKAAVRMFSRTVAIECADAETGIRVNLVTPGGVTTPMWEKQPFFQALIEQHDGTDGAFAALTGDQPSQRFLTAEEVAKTILYLSSDDSSHLNGVEVVLDCGHSA